MRHKKHTLAAWPPSLPTLPLLWLDASAGVTEADMGVDTFGTAP